MDLVDEEDRAPSAPTAIVFGFCHHRANFLDSRQDRAEGDESRARHARDDARERRLSGSGRSPENDRLQPIALDGASQRTALAEEILLADELVEGLRPHPFGERRGGRGGGGSMRPRGAGSGGGKSDMSISLLCCFVENQRGGDGDVERFDRRAHRDREPLVGGGDERIG